MFRPILILALAAAGSLSACKQELPKGLKEPPAFGTYTETRTVPSERQLIYAGGEDPYGKSWGSSAGYYIKVDEVWYSVLWDDAPKLKDLKPGDKVNLHPSEFIACTGENDLKPSCHRLMRVYKSHRRINPLIINN
ncbi:MAG: hypothetical protein VKS61_01905 [Candidatus Sericytochromatia bacterium]|nr:hypothetical protein [Candidatus Sericytochromatia bacterium]